MAKESPRETRSHVVILDHDGFAADVGDTPSNWNPAFPHSADPAILVCIPRFAFGYEELRAEHEAVRKKGTNR